jgi:hypothetical protein
VASVTRFGLIVGSRLLVSPGSVWVQRPPGCSTAAPGDYGDQASWRVQKPTHFRVSVTTTINARRANRRLVDFNINNASLEHDDAAAFRKCRVRSMTTPCLFLAENILKQTCAHELLILKSTHAQGRGKYGGRLDNFLLK